MNTFQQYPPYLLQLHDAIQKRDLHPSISITNKKSTPIQTGFILIEFNVLTWVLNFLSAYNGNEGYCLTGWLSDCLGGQILQLRRKNTGCHYNSSWRGCVVLCMGVCVCVFSDVQLLYSPWIGAIHYTSHWNDNSVKCKITKH